MRLTQGGRVRLAVELRLPGEVTLAADPAGSADPAGAPAAAVAEFLALAPGTEGTVERVEAYEREPGRGVREYERLSSLLGDFGHQMPPASRQQLEERIDGLRAEWLAHQEQRVRVSVRVRFDNGFVLDGATEEIFLPA